MCKIVVIDLGEKELACPKHLEEHFGHPTNVSPDDMEFCLCGFDISHYLRKHGIVYKVDASGDYYVGKLHMVRENE